MLATFTARSARKKGPQLLWLLGLVSLISAVPAYSQSLGDIARQERERKQSQTTHATHVYDNSDLQRAQILVPDDQQRAESAKPKTAPAESSPAEGSAGGESGTDTLPLGDIARKYRAMKAQSQKSESAANSASEGSQAGLHEIVGSPSESTVGSEIENGVEPLGDVARRYRAMQAQNQNAQTQPKSFRLPQSESALAYPSLPRPAAKMVASGSPTSAGATEVAKARASAPVVIEENAGSKGVRVKVGDTLWKIAAEYLGRGEEWPALVGDNPQLSAPARLQIGVWVRLPEVGRRFLSRRENPAAVPARLVDATKSVRVERGNSLWKVAQKRFGNGEAWLCVAQANPQIQNANLLFPGQILTIPDGCADSLGGERQAASSAAALSSRGPQ